MATNERNMTVYLPQELLSALDEEAYKKALSRSSYVKDIIVNHLSKGDEGKRLRLLGRDKGRKK